MSSQTVRQAAIAAHFASDFATTVTLASGATLKAIAGVKGSRQLENTFGALTVAQLMDRGASDTSMLSVLDTDYTPEAFSRPFIIGSGGNARTWQCERAVPLRDGNDVSLWQLLIHQGALLGE